MPGTRCRSCNGRSSPWCLPLRITYAPVIFCEYIVVRLFLQQQERNIGIDQINQCAVIAVRSTSRGSVSIIILSTRDIRLVTSESRKVKLRNEWSPLHDGGVVAESGDGFGGRGRRIGDLGGIKGGRGSCLVRT